MVWKWLQVIRNGLPVEEPSGLDPTIGGSFNSDSVVGTAPDQTQSSGDVHRTNPSTSGDSGRGSTGDEVDDVHTTSNIAHTVTLSIPEPVEKKKIPSNSGGMNPNWPTQEIFIDKVRSYAIREGLISKKKAILYDAIAARFGVSPITLRQYIDNKGRPEPELATYRKIAKAMGIDVSDLLSSPRPGRIPENLWATFDDPKKTAMDALLQIVQNMDYKEIKSLITMIELSRGLKSKGAGHPIP